MDIIENIDINVIRTSERLIPPKIQKILLSKK